MKAKFMGNFVQYWAPCMITDLLFEITQTLIEFTPFGLTTKNQCISYINVMQCASTTQNMQVLKTFYVRQLNRRMWSYESVSNHAWGPILYEITRIDSTWIFIRLESHRSQFFQNLPISFNSTFSNRKYLILRSGNVHCIIM